jgi:hypothetical protein
MLKYYLVLIAVILILSFSLSAGEQKICEYCKKPIEGQYLTVDTHYFHPDHFLCSYCRKPIEGGQYYNVNGAYYDAVCYKLVVAPKCAYCGEPIEGQYIESENKKYHKECYEGHIGLRCALCGGLIQDQYIQDAWGDIYHAFHLNVEPQCRYCGRFLSAATDGGQTYSDGRTVCGICIKSAVNDIDEAELICLQIADRLASFGIEIKLKDIKLSLIDSREMARINHAGLSDPLGYTYYEEATYLLGLMKERRLRVWLLNGMPQKQFVSAAAHELMHVWIYRNSSAAFDMNDLMCEGSCSYASYLILKDDPSPEARYYLRELLENKDPVYGEGMRKVKSWLDGSDIPGWLNYLAENRNPPWDKK